MTKKGLYYNINKRKKAGTSRPKSKSTISAKAFANMKKGFPKKRVCQTPYTFLWRLAEESLGFFMLCFSSSMRIPRNSKESQEIPKKSQRIPRNSEEFQ